MFGLRPVLILNLLLVILPLTFLININGKVLDYSVNSEFRTKIQDLDFQPENKYHKDSTITCNQDGVLKILAIGNSFSEDAIENYLFELGAAEKIDMVIGNLVIGGASLDLHRDNANENAPVYHYRKISQNGDKSTLPNTTLAFGIFDENWDYISFQQVSGKSGKFETFYRTPICSSRVR